MTDEKGRVPTKSAPKVLAVASTGGHWVQLLRMRPAWDGCKVSYITTNEGHRDALLADANLRAQDLPRFFTAPAANRWQRLRLFLLGLRILWIVIWIRPKVIISTGAAPGFFALLFGKLIGARTIWVDSIANADRMSLSGRLVRPFTDLWLTQWEHLEGSEYPEANAPSYKGAVI